MRVHNTQGISTFVALFEKNDGIDSCFLKSNAPLSITKRGTHTFTTVNETRKKKEFLVSSKFDGETEV